MALFGRKSESRALATADQRDPTAATQSIRYTTPGRAVPPDWDAATAFAAAYYQSMVVYACVKLYASTLSRLPFRTGADPNRPKDFDPNSPLARLLGPPPGGPTPTLSARRLWAWTVAQRLVTGRNGWEIETAPGSDVPSALWPLASSSLRPGPSTSGVNWFAGFEYGRPGAMKKLRLEQVAYDWDPSGVDFRQPESALQAANLDIAVSIMQSRYDFAFLKNDSRPAALVVTEQFEDEDNFEAFKRQWNTAYSGVDNAGRTAFVEATGAGDQGVKGAVDVTVLGISQKDAQAAQRHTAAMERTAMALGVAWSLLDASGRTFSNAGQEWQNWVTTRLIPLACDFQDMVNMQLAPRLGNQVGWFDLTSLGIEETPNPITSAVGAPTMVQAQLMWINEARADYGLPALPDGDRMMTVDEITALKGAAGPADVVRMLTDFEARMVEKIEVREPESTGQAPLAPAPEPVGHVDMLADEQVEARRTKLWNQANSRLTALEKQWTRGLRKLFARQERAVIMRLESKRGRAASRGEARALADEVFDPAHWLDETRDDTAALYEAVAAASGARVSDLFGLDFDLDAAWVQDFIRARANQLAGQVTQTTYEAIQGALQAGVSEGEAIPELAKRIEDVFDTASTSRAVTIARTETVSAYNGAATLTASSYGPDVVAGQEWIATRDSRTRDEHAGRDGEIVAVGEAFSGGLMYPGDPSGDAADTVNCRCTVALLTPKEMADAGRSRMVERRLAHAVLALIQPDHDERTIRSALRAVAA